MDTKKTVMLSAACLFIGMGAGAGGMWLKNKDDIAFAKKFSVLADVDRIMTEKKAKMNRSDKMEELVVNGYLSSYDKYTRYYVDNVLNNRVNITNNMPCLPGCGFQIEIDDYGQLRIAFVEPGSTAEKQGLQEGDIILKIDENDLTKNIEDHVKDLMGAKGTTVKLLLRRGSANITVNFVRDYETKEAEPGVTAKMIENNILYIKINYFDIDTDALFGGTAVPFLEKAEGVIVDLRGNSGGDGKAAVAVSDRFTGAGSMTKYYYKGGKESLYTVDSEEDIKLPTIILVNERTASAAEIMTGFLKQYGSDVTVVGTDTFGKGIFQEEEYLEDDATIYYTAGYFTVGGWDCWQDVGIKPDIAVEMEHSLIGTEDDVQMKKALELLG